MQARNIAVLAAVVALAVQYPLWTGGALAQSNPAALTGKVTSDREGPIEGVLVSAKRQGSTVTVTVVTDAKGEYAFPAPRLDAGRLSPQRAGDGLCARPRRDRHAHRRPAGQGRSQAQARPGDLGAADQLRMAVERARPR